MGYIERDGVKIHYEIHGKQNKTPLLLLMGLGADQTVWEPHRQEYQKYFCCISVDNRGAGSSDLGNAEICTTDIMAEDAIAVLQALNIRRSLVAEISMGGAIAQKILVKKPDLVQALVLIDSFGKASAYMKRIMKTLETCYSQLEPLEFDRVLQAFIYAPQTFEADPEMIRERERGIGTGGRMSLEAFEAQCEACIHHNAMEELKNITVPALVAAGKQDLLVSVSEAEELATCLNAELQVLEGGHVQHFEHVERFNKLSTEFFLRHAENREV